MYNIKQKNSTITKKFNPKACLEKVVQERTVDPCGTSLEPVSSIPKSYRYSPANSSELKPRDDHALGTGTIT